ncbi:Phage integrase SAM-like domain-containing protein [Parapedobacter composti]|uniref:Phage integrase SAM-like domain-containing protein n=1 Tax=Parapedobacter composti TaxID=623281 RepID=A0A1I1G6N4_9SPHI|nr:site-specific integrase [Parapedobacter composti]SFC07214.1 Phage integrase SAM-like domain-containing protein [Parapedobacter composti]
MTRKIVTGNFPVNVRFNLRATKPANKETAINCIVRFNNERLVISGVSKVQPRYWNAEKGMPTQHAGNADSGKIRQKLLDADKTINRIFDDYVNEHNAFPCDLKAFHELLRRRVFNIPDEVEKPEFDNLFDYLTHFIIRCEKGLRLSDKGLPLTESSIKTYRTMLRNVKMFRDAGNDVSFNALGLEFYEDYREFLTLTLRYGANTVGKHLRTLKAVVNEAREDGFTAAIFSGKRYKVKNESVTNVYLNKGELQRIWELDLSANPTTLERARDLFIIGANTALRFGDWLKLDPSRMVDDIIEVKTQKTGATVAVPINSMVKDVFVKYSDSPTGLPKPMTNQELNRYIKTIAKMAKIDEPVEIEKTKAGKRITVTVPKHTLVSSHTARRSGATNMYIEGIPTLSIMKITGHTTETNFMKYIKLSDKQHARKVLEVSNRKNLKVVGGGE